MSVDAHISNNATKSSAQAATRDNGRFAWVYDPEGNKVELWEPK